MTRQEARALARQLSKQWVSTRLKGSRAARKDMEAQITAAHWKKLQRENPVLQPIR